MSVFLAGTGWVTPLGSGVEEVWERLNRGDQAQSETITNPEGTASYPVFKVPASALSALPLHPRLRRASAISRFAAAAGLAAISDAEDHGLTIDSGRIALVYAISNGGVIYTRRFYHDIVHQGAAAASPILFPETVFNAPASHLAALLNIPGQTYTLVGDGSVGLSAINMAEALLADERLEACLVVGAEEIDWLLCDAYAQWRLLQKTPDKKRASGFILSEGAGAILLGRSGGIRLEKSHAAIHYESRRELPGRLRTLLAQFELSEREVVVGSSNGTFIDRAESETLREMTPRSLCYMPKRALGESVGASGLWQTVLAARALQAGHLPPSLDSRSANEPVEFESHSAMVISCGLNQGLAALRLGI
jgi:3-oxoacyl-(acyl-carrier-protein) synthase